MSARAAWRLEDLGFAAVYRYAAGKADWLANGLPWEGEAAALPRAADAARRDVPTCGPEERLGEARRRARAAGWEQCLVVNEQCVVLGRLRADALEDDAERIAEAVMDPGPVTVRPDTPLEDLVQHLRHTGVPEILVTTADGVLVGVLSLADAERRLAGVSPRSTTSG